MLVGAGGCRHAPPLHVWCGAGDGAGSREHSGSDGRQHGDVESTGIRKVKPLGVTVDERNKMASVFLRVGVRARCDDLLTPTQILQPQQQSRLSDSHTAAAEILWAVWRDRPLPLLPAMAVAQSRRPLLTGSYVVLHSDAFEALFSSASGQDGRPDTRCRCTPFPRGLLRASTPTSVAHCVFQVRWCTAHGVAGMLCACGLVCWRLLERPRHELVCSDPRVAKRLPVPAQCCRW